MFELNISFLKVKVGNLINIVPKIKIIEPL